MVTSIMRPNPRPGLSSTAGFSLIEMTVAMGLLTVIMGATLGGLSSVMKGNEIVMAIATMNNSVRAGMDLILRDLLQVGSGLPASHTVTIPSGNNALQVRIPGPPGTTFLTAVGDTSLPAVMPFAQLGPTINGVPTDALSVLMADNAFFDIGLTAVAGSSVVVAAGPVLDAGPDRVTPGQLMLISKGSINALVQVTAVDVPGRRLTFADGDSMRLNQSDAETGTLPALNAADPVDAPASTRISRLRMITYYLDATTEPARPRLVRRVNNGHETSFDNTLGTAVAIDVRNLQFAYDISNGAGNPGNVEMVTGDMVAGGACGAAACARTQIRKVNVTLMSRSPQQLAARTSFLSNTLESQVSLRAMAFVDRYR